MQILNYVIEIKKNIKSIKKVLELNDNEIHIENSTTRGKRAVSLNSLMKLSSVCSN